MMFDFEVADEEQEAVLKQKDKQTFFWKYVADPNDPLRVTHDLTEAKKFDNKKKASEFLYENNLDDRGFIAVELDHS